MKIWQKASFLADRHLHHTVHALIFNTVTPCGERAFYVVVGGSPIFLGRKKSCTPVMYTCHELSTTASIKTMLS